MDADGILVHVRAGLGSLSEQQDAEADVLDKAFAVLPSSRLGCQSKVADADVVVEISPESRQAWLSEHPEARKAADGR